MPKSAATKRKAANVGDGWIHYRITKAWNKNYRPRSIKIVRIGNDGGVISSLKFFLLLILNWSKMSNQVFL